ncbi:hypothetical protein A2W67_00925 [Candidatus Nomurabacteria bacterium RIFCSPLOWO2_02_40_28]|uniref:Uncharacterized protein n=2 Tax=Candidatus Nomuraibacteriota TaxID=1752729 RepID=A0A837HRS8_9BACT|nr:MAG: hypothetical protein UT27_C0001G0013 [Candidatus Nomurabacteria bacterium GW2011_GWD2_39_12]KKR20720.1 MAG: hypothetical protein UT51_C0002G0155 [Candidatus Nomurabacteria bacterium GW2011_GWC2_39_41]KKR37352.1 MAG: hypothetical protein UT70_C0001G0028 [Candidatus Nomurabacteria bacterium GW2011_GWE2_40_10]KKR38599.1 MAG: hypothetical protein UT73_C0002G0084 [Candidatus Nomurabacteria bacterium GW2011_GWB1_40_11]KKR40324.1 MAG: hypothetical protein UT74_C0001G0058 [Parcubacteria group b
MKLKKVKMSDIQEGPIRHLTLPDGFIQRVKEFKQALAEVEKTSLESTLENFQRDTNPENELRVWEKIASTYQWAVIDNVGLIEAEKKDVFGILLGLSMGMKDFSNFKNLSKEKVAEVVSHFS